MANTYVFENADQAIAVYGNPVTARRKTLVTVREVNGETEVFPRANGDLTAVKGVDLVVVPVDGTAPYPCKINLFAGEEGAWVEEPGSGMYRRKALCRYLNIPEGDATASYPDAIALGVGGEVYTYRRTWIESNLEPVG